MQFGANDQKATANISLSEYQANLENMTDQVRAAGGTPVRTYLYKAILAPNVTITLYSPHT